MIQMQSQSSESAHPRLMLRHPREMSQVDERLQALFRALCRGEAPWPLLLHGPAGTGKTSAALALCDFAATACYHTLDQLCDQIMSHDADFDWIAGKALAVLDELGTRNRASDLPYSAAKRFADARYGLPTIYVTNLRPSQLVEAFDDRVASRVCCGTWFCLDGDDRRCG